MQNRARLTSNDPSNQTRPTAGYLFRIYSIVLVRPLPKKIQIKQHLPPEEIRRLYKKEKDKKKAIRLLAIYHLMKGKKPEELAELLQMNTSTVYRLIQRWNEHGLAGIEDNKKGAENRP